MHESARTVVMSESQTNSYYIPATLRMSLKTFGQRPEKHLVR